MPLGISCTIRSPIALAQASAGSICSRPRSAPEVPVGMANACVQHIHSDSPPCQSGVGCSNSLQSPERCCSISAQLGDGMESLAACFEQNSLEFALCPSHFEEGHPTVTRTAS